MATPSYVDYDAALPVATGKSVTELVDDIRDNLNAMVDGADNPDVLIVRTEYTYDAAPTDTRVVETLAKHPGRWIKVVYTYGTSGASENLPTSAAVTYSTDDGVTWAAVRTKTWSWSLTSTGRPRLDYTDTV